MSTQINYTNNLAFAQKAIRYVNGQDLKEKSAGQTIKESLPSSVGTAALFELAPDARRALKFKELLKDGALTKNEYKAAITGTVKDSDTIKKIGDYFEKKALNDGAQTAAKKSTSFTKKIFKNFGKKSAEGVAKEAVKESAQAAAANAGKEAVESAVTKAGEKAVKSATSKAATKVVTKGLLGEIKGFFLFNMATQLLEIIPAFKRGGFTEGVKQIGKSILNSAGDAIGYTAGMKLGAAAGTAIGGPIGTIVGGIAGMVLGGIASTIVGKGISKIFGKNFNEKEAEAQTEAQSQEMAADQATMQELSEAVAQKIAEDQADGKVSKDTEEMIAELDNFKKSNVSFGNLTNNQVNSQANNQTYTQQIQPGVYQTTTQPITPQATTQPQTINAVANGVNMGVRNNILNQQAQGIYEINNIPRNPDGSIDHRIYNASVYIPKTV